MLSDARTGLVVSAAAGPAIAIGTVNAATVTAVAANTRFTFEFVTPFSPLSYRNVAVALLPCASLGWFDAAFGRTRES
ncbi:hypothetical protein [Streptomyces sirii]|uniref:hypothetical protein n=1 Tax=Streptomyces sirii TaxID=3127701 RepID=UPI003D369889